MLSLPCHLFLILGMHLPRFAWHSSHTYMLGNGHKVASARRCISRCVCDNAGAWDQVELTIQRSSQLADHASGHTHHGQPQDTSTPSQSLQHGQLQHVLPASLQDLHQQEQSKELREQHNMVNNSPHHQQPVASPFAAASYGPPYAVCTTQWTFARTQWANATTQWPNPSVQWAKPDL